MIYASFIAQVAVALEFESASGAAGFVHSHRIWHMVYVEKCSILLPHEAEPLSKAFSNWIVRNKSELNAAEALFNVRTYNNPSLIEAVKTAARTQATESFFSIPPEDRASTCELFLRQKTNGELDFKVIAPHAYKLLNAYAEGKTK